MKRIICTCAVAKSVGFAVVTILAELSKAYICNGIDQIGEVVNDCVSVTRPRFGRYLYKSA